MIYISKKERMYIKVQLLLFVVSVNVMVVAQSYSNYSTLVNDVLAGYNTDLIPIDDGSNTLTISVSCTLYYLMDVNVVSGTFRVLLALDAYWTDSLIHWIPDEYGNITEIYLPQNKIWSPILVLGTPVDFTLIGEPWVPVRITSNGSAEAMLGDMVNSACVFNMRFWPFDKHVCDISFLIYGYPMSLVRLRKAFPENYKHIDSSDDNNEWVITDVSSFIREDRGLSEIIFRIELQRRSGIYIIIVILPLYGLAFLNPFVFLLYCNTGERVGFSMTILLSMTVHLDAIGDYIPNASKPIPYLCNFVTVGIFSSLFCTLTVILGLHCHHQDVKPVPLAFLKLVQCFNKDFRNRKVEHIDNLVQNDGNKADYGNNGKQNTETVIAKSGQNTTTSNTIEWVHVCNAIDRIGFAVFTVLNTVIGFLLILYLTVAST